VPGPGLTNALTGIGEALLDSVPIVGIITDVKRGPDAPVGQVHSLFNAALLRPVTKAVIEVQHQAQIPGAIHRAFQVARCGEPGPVGVVLPFPLYTEVWDYDGQVPPPPPPPFDETAYRRALGLLSDRRLRVGIYAGMGCVDAGRRWRGSPSCSRRRWPPPSAARGPSPTATRLAVGWGYGKQGTRAAEKAFRDVDLVLAVGVRYSEVSTANYAIPAHDHLIHVDANPQALGRNVPASVGVCADAGCSSTACWPTPRPSAARPARRCGQQIRQDRALDRRENAQVRITAAVDPMHFLVHLRHALGPEELIFVDVTAATHWASEAIDVCGPRRYFTPANNQSMGWAVPAAIGAQRVRLDRRVAAVTGDGCFLMSGLEASTAARACLPVKFFVLDDGAYHYMQMLQEPTFRRTTATEIARLDFAALARGLGLGYNQIAHNADVPAGIARALCQPGPVLTRVIVSYEGREIRWLNALKASYIDHLSTGQKVRMASRIVVRVHGSPPGHD
jgi:acetolactate synthase-1/2/3 large subunit